MFGKRKIWIDYCKAVAIILVIFGHILEKMSMSKIESLLYLSIYSFHMPLFFVLSGFTFKNVEKVGAFIGKKFRRLLFPYVCFAIADVVFSLIFYKLTDEVALNEYILSFKGVVPIVNTILITNKSCFLKFWFLPVLFIVLIIFRLLFGVKNQLIQLILIIFGIIIAIQLKKYKISPPLGLGEAFLALPFLFVGFGLKDNVKFYKNTSLKNIIICFAVYISSFIYWLYKDYWVIYMYNSTIDNVFAFYLLGISGSLLIIFLIQMIDNSLVKEIHIFSWIGKNSLYIFGIHYMLREIYVYVMLKFNISNILIKLLVDVLGTVIILLGCAAIIHMVDMIKKYKNNNDWIMDR